MANLLPQESQKNIRQEYRFRRIITAFFWVFAVTLFAGILLVPSLLLLSIKVKESEASLKLSRESQTQSVETKMKEIVFQTNARTTLLDADGDVAPVVSGLVSYLLRTKPDAIAINGIFYDKAKDDSFDKASVRGVAKSREALFSYVTFLETNGYFEQALLPISHFVQERDIDFTIQLKIKLRGKGE